MNIIHNITHNLPNSHFPSFPILPMNTSTTKTYEGNKPSPVIPRTPTLLRRYGVLTHSFDASFQQLSDIPIKPIPIKNETPLTTPFFLEQPKLVGTKREKVDLGLDNLPWVSDNSWNEILQSATPFDGF
jgi:hypothetical protein